MTSALALVVVGCLGKPPADSRQTRDTAPDQPDSADSADTSPIDADADGYPAAVDCDDDDPTIHPGATDACNGADDDCDGDVDEDAPEWHVDADGDGYGSAETVRACEEGAGAVADATDCDDANVDVHPGGFDWCGDGVDQDCDAADAACGPAVLAVDIGAVILADDPDYYTGYWGQLDVGDIDTDGLGDVLIGAADRSTARTEGQAYIMGSPVRSGTDTAAAVAVLLCGSARDDLCGFGLAAVGDVDGDGNEDVVVGNPGSSTDNGALLYLGPLSGTVDRDSAATVWSPVGEPGLNALGEDVLGADLNGDGFSDVILGDSYHESGLAAVLVYTAPFPPTLGEDDAAARLFGEGWYPPADFGYLSVRGDVDGDGYLDLVLGRDAVGTYDTWAGAVYIFRGPFAGDRQPSDADAVIDGTEYNQGVGMAVDTCDDQDGDGRDEVVVSTSAEDALGANLLLGPLSGTYLLPDDADGAVVNRDNTAFLGARLQCLGDLDADGFGDLALTAWSADSNGTDSGSAFLYFGPLLGLHDGNAADLEIRGEPGDELGTNIGSGDTDGDGVTDLLVGARGHGDAGAVYVITGADLLAAVGR